MKSDIICVNCKASVSHNSKFCPECGKKIRCTNCDEILPLNSKFCFSCGSSVITDVNGNTAFNKIKYKETKEEREYEVIFTDKVGGEVTNVIMNMFQNKPSYFENPQILVPSNSLNENKIELDNRFVPEDAEIEIIPSGNVNYPHINDLLMKFEFSEKDWIIIFSFYVSEFGMGNFTKEIVMIKYKELRMTPQRMKNFSFNWKSAFKSYFSTVREDQLKLNEAGIKHVSSIVIDGPKNTAKSKSTDGVKKVKIASKSKPKPATVMKTVKLEEFDIYNTSTKLSELFDKINPTSTNEKILTIAYYINKILNKEFFTDGNIDYAYKVLKLDNRPGSLRQTIINIKTRELWFDKSGKNWILNRNGEIFFEEKLSKK